MTDRDQNLVRAFRMSIVRQQKRRRRAGCYREDEGWPVGLEAASSNLPFEYRKGRNEDRNDFVLDDLRVAKTFKEPYGSERPCGFIGANHQNAAKQQK